MSDGLFHVIEDAQIIVRRKGVYKQCKLYSREGKVYAGWGSGFILLMKTGGTSIPDANWDTTSWPVALPQIENGFYIGTAKLKAIAGGAR